MHSCVAIESLVTPYVDGELPESERQQVDAHLRACPPCASRVTAERAVRALVHDHQPSLRSACAPARLRTTCQACTHVERLFTAGAAKTIRPWSLARYLQPNDRSDGGRGASRIEGFVNMKIRWMVAILGVIALAALTVTTQMPWLLTEETAMVETGADAGTVGRSDNHTPMLSCPADAKAANLAFTLKDVAGADVALSDYKGKVILLDFWATWCGPCKVEIPHFVEFQEQFGKDGLQILGVSVDDTVDKLVPYVRDMKMNYPVLQGLDRQDLQDAYGPIVGIPVSVLISRDGKICATHTGLTGKDVFEREIKALL